MACWPAGTVFVSVVDPGVGTERRPVVARLKTGQLVVTPDNGTLTFLAAEPGLAEVREIDAARQRLPGSEASHTFHGRDLFAYVAARLASGRLRLRDVGPARTGEVVRIPHQAAELRDGVLRGTVSVSDVRFGNVWSNIPKALFERLGVQVGDRLAYTFRGRGRVVHEGVAPYAPTFGVVPEGEPLVFLNSLLEVAFALNQGSFADRHGIGSGPDWTVEVRKAP